MRTPPRFNVASDRPEMMHVPRSVIVIQSPWRHTPGYESKYAARYRLPSSSPQNPTGIDGIGAVSTSSPCAPMTALPVFVEGLDLGAEAAAADLARDDRLERNRGRRTRCTRRCRR